MQSGPDDRLALIRHCYQAYENDDRPAIERLLHPDFTFTSPDDDGSTGPRSSSDKQGTFTQSRFLDACRAHNRGELSQDQLIEQTARLGFNNVIDAFHVVNQGDVPVRFFVDELRQSTRGIRLTDALRLDPCRLPIPQLSFRGRGPVAAPGGSGGFGRLYGR